MADVKPEDESSIRQQPRGFDSRETPAIDVFPDFVDDNDDVCSRCFRQKYDVLDVDDERIADREIVVRDGDEEVVELEQLVRRTETTIRDFVPRNEGESLADLEKTICRCGDVDRSSIETRSRSEAVDHAENLVETLWRWGVPINRRELVGRVVDGKRDPELAGSDWLIFDLAVTAAVRECRGYDVDSALEDVFDRH